MMNEDLMMATFEYIMCFYLEAIIMMLHHHDELYMSDQMGGKLHSKLHQKNMTSKTFFLIIEFENIS